METKFFNFTDVLGYGWRVMKANFWFFVGLVFLLMILSYLTTIVDIIISYLSLPEPVLIVSKIATTIIGQVIGFMLAIGSIKIALAFCDERKPKLSTLFDAWDCFWRYIGTAILYGLIILGGFVLFIVPGIIWAIKFSLCYYFVIDKGLGSVNALKASGRTTMGVKWELLGFGILCGLINFLGFLCLIVGIFATYPTILVAITLVYRQLLAQTPELAEFGITAPGDRSDFNIASDSESLPNSNWQGL